MSRKVTIGVVAAVVIVVAAAAFLFGRKAVEGKDSPPDQSALRVRVFLLEADPFVAAVMAISHSTQSIQENLRCRPPGPARWNLSEQASGGLDLDRVRAVIANASAYGWSAGSSSAFHKTIEGDALMDLWVSYGTDQVELTINASDGLSCRT